MSLVSSGIIMGADKLLSFEEGYLYVHWKVMLL
jgi:hypothetical protein